MARVKEALLPDYIYEGETMTDNIQPDATTQAKLVQYIQRIERLSDEKAALQADIKDVFADAKANGFDVKAMRGVIKLRKLAEQERREQEELLELYKSAVGME